MSEAIQSPAAPIALSPVPRLLLRPAEAAAALGISQRLLWARTRDGSIPCVRLGSAVRYSEAALRAWVAQQ